MKPTDDLAGVITHLEAYSGDLWQQGIADRSLAVGEAIRSANAVRAELGRLREIERCARGVVQTSHPANIYDAVVSDWWDALKRAVGITD